MPDHFPPQNRHNGAVYTRFGPAEMLRIDPDQHGNRMARRRWAKLHPDDTPDVDREVTDEEDR